MKPRVVVVQVKLVTNESTEDLKEQAKKLYPKNHKYIEYKQTKKGRMRRLIEVETQVKQVMTFIYKE